ncbi:MAG: BspA family leucine-rich repeat surface protein [Flavobacteriaceae bacterium]|nr:BspA family leucine-rich repeat surface protein [Flavobacteriaceae bacterium]
MENTAPSIQNQDFTVAEGIADADAIGTVTATDADNDALSFSITQNDNDLFAITEGGELSLTDSASLDFETAESHTITVEVTDGTDTASATVTINVTDVNENTAPTIEDQDFTVSEDISDTHAIGTVTATDADNDALTYSISQNDNGLFEITEAGELSLAPGASLDFATASVHTIIVQVADGTDTASATVTINVTEVDETSFITKWETSSANETVTIPINTDFSTYDYTVDWGDGNSDGNVTGDASHTYAMPGTYRVTITGSFPAMFFTADSTSRTQIRTVEQWGDQQWLSMSNTFFFTTDLTFNALDVPDLSQVTDMTNMFANSHFNGDISGWDVSNVTDILGMFAESPFNQDIGDWDVGNVRDMRFMFQFSPFNQDIAGWDVSNVTDMRFMFTDSTFNQDISGWDTGSVTFMIGMFQFSQFNQDISGWDVGNVTLCSSFANGGELVPENFPNFTNCDPN